ncbi:MAG: polymerase sigma factor [Paenibacillus sp.]|jgi:RNA polymerase sigma-70 factor (ECF subfamily)|uniref:sigma-70 family RNA polymerase sigma factor n=1 Tax=Paenibacillus sp. GCM10012303 TaxID=3317340 RepID=UPI0029E98894|nr:polymerase sigma factor [Paenibacillus sp.]
MNQQPTYELLKMVCDGDTESFGQLYALTRLDVYRTVYFLLNDKQDTPDVVSEVYMELLRCLKDYKEDKPFRSWLNGLTVRQARNWNRRLWRKFRLSERNKTLEIRLPEVDAAHEVLRSESRNELWTRIEQLPFKLKAVIVLRYYQDCPLEEIADILGIPTGTVKSRHHLALKKLRLALRELPEFAKEESVHANG